MIAITRDGGRLLAQLTRGPRSLSIINSGVMTMPTINHACEIILGVIALTLLVIISSTWFTIDATERGVVLRLGALFRSAPPGLGRNDIGRVAEISSVQVTDRMVTQRYSHVMYIVSNVTGHLRPGIVPLDVLRATFAAGTVRGAPKIRAMEIIDELEPIKRGIYAGAVGYLSWAGNMDTAIAIRTARIKDGTRHIQRRRYRRGLGAEARMGGDHEQGTRHLPGGVGGARIEGMNTRGCYPRVGPPTGPKAPCTP